MITLIDRESVFQVKPEAMNEKVKRESETGTIAGRSYAKGWNACLKMWHEEIEKIPLVERMDGDPIVDIYIGRCSEIPNSSDCVSKRAAVETIANQSRFSAEEIINICDKSVQDENGWLGGLKEAILAVLELPSAQPEVDEWCTDCPAYDHEKHYCPRFNRVIRETVEEIKPERKSVIYYEDGYCDGCMVYDTAECPSCGYIFDEDDLVWKAPFCPHCGQRLTWKGEQDD